MTEPGRRPPWPRVIAVAAVGAAVLAGGCQRDPESRAHGPTPPGGDGHQLHSNPGSSAMTINSDQLRTWSEQLCPLPPVDFAAAIAALGITGSLVAKSSDFSIVEPPPTGASRVGLTLENLGKNRGYLSTLEVTLDAKVTRGELDQRFGAGNLLPRVDYDRPFAINYRVEVPGAPYRVTVSASFDEEPAAPTAARQISLRRDVVRTPSPMPAPPGGS